HIVLGIQDALEFEGFRVVTAENGAEALTCFEREQPQAVLLDLMLPDMNGYQVCERIRELSALVPVIMLTAKSQETDKIRGLDVGADDYVTKPFSVGELCARIRALFRRTSHLPESQKELQIGEATLNLSGHTWTRAGVEDALSVYEVELLRLLLERRGQAVSRDEILQRVWGLEKSPNNRSIDNFVVKLRRKIEKKPEKPKHILTVYGLGYKLVI
ncbi:MAG: response regulator transcription factor, partial [Polyangiaceae bacterium]|nr:response regulator transcription factor [Polyangiaceae bacterium]